MAYRRGIAAQMERYNREQRRRTQKTTKGLVNFLIACCSACVALFALCCKALFWLAMQILKLSLWCWKQVAAAAIYVALGVQEWWHARN